MVFMLVASLLSCFNVPIVEEEMEKEEKEMVEVTGRCGGGWWWRFVVEVVEVVEVGGGGLEVSCRCGG